MSTIPTGPPIVTADSVRDHYAGEIPEWLKAAGLTAFAFFVVGGLAVGAAYIVRTRF